MAPYAVYVSVAAPVSFFTPWATFSLADVCSGARSGVTGGIEVAVAALREGCSVYFVVSAYPLEAMKLVDTFCD